MEIFPNDFLPESLTVKLARFTGFINLYYSLNNPVKSVTVEEEIKIQ